MIDLWNKANKENHVECYGYSHKQNVNEFSIYSKAVCFFRGREIRSRQNIDYEISDTMKKNKDLCFIETGDHVENLQKDDVINYAGRILIIDSIPSAKVDNSQLMFSYSKPSVTTLFVCRGKING